MGRSLMGLVMLPHALSESSKRSASRALVAFGADDWPEAAFHAGQAVEHLAKALLRDQRPELLADPNDSASMAFLTGEGHADVKSLADVHTISLPMAVSLACDELACERPDEADLDLVSRARNAAIEIGYGDPQESLATVAAMVRVCERLLSSRGETIPEWLGDSRLTEVIEAMRGLPREDVRLSSLFRKASVQARLWEAKRVWDRLRERMPEMQWLDAATYPKELSGNPRLELEACPTGGHLAWFKIQPERSEDDDPEVHDPSYDEYEVVTLWVGGMDCALCGLSLGDSDEVEALGLEGNLGEELHDL